MFSILCFGDSNTYGYDSDSASRYDMSTRWAGRLCGELGPDFHVIEAGTNGMTVAFDEVEDDGVYRNGLACLPTYILSQHPIDLISIMLGTNDTKHHFASDAESIAENLRSMIKFIKSNPFCAATKILIVAPVPLIIQTPPLYDMDEQSGIISRQLGAAYEKVCRQEGVYFADAGKWGIELNPDGVHISRKGGYRYAKEIAAVIKGIFCD